MGEIKRDEPEQEQQSTPETKQKPEQKEGFLKKEQIDGLKEYTKEVIRRWHDEFKPDYIFLNETGAVPLGYVLKEAYRATYGDEKAPSFYRVNPAILPSYHRGFPYGVHPKLAQNHIFLERVEKFFKDRIKKENSTVVVVDEWSASGASPRAVEDVALKCGANKVFFERGDERTEFFRGQPRFTTKKIRAKSNIKETARLNPKTAKLRGAINRDESNDKLLNYMHELESIGKMAGEELRDDLSKSDEKELNKQ